MTLPRDKRSGFTGTNRSSGNNLSDPDFEFFDIDNYDSKPTSSGTSRRREKLNVKKTDSNRKTSLNDNDYKEALEDAKLGPSTLQWFNTLMIMQIPLINVFYCIYLIVSSKDAKRNYAMAWLLINLVFIMLVLAIFVITLNYTVDLMDSVLEYMEML